MTLTRQRPPSPMEESPDALPRTDVDVEAQLEALRDFVVKGGITPLNHRLWLDLEEFEARIEEIIGLLPKEVRRARRITREEQRIIQDAQDEARRILEETRAEGEQIIRSSREEAQRMVEASAIRQRALEQSEQILERAEASAREIRDRSYSYAQQVIDNVLDSLRRLRESVEADKRQLEDVRPDRDRRSDLGRDD